MNNLHLPRFQEPTNADKVKYITAAVYYLEAQIDASGMFEPYNPDTFHEIYHHTNAIIDILQRRTKEKETKK